MHTTHACTHMHVHNTHMHTTHTRTHACAEHMHTTDTCMCTHAHTCMRTPHMHVTIHACTQHTHACTQHIHCASSRSSTHWLYLGLGMKEPREAALSFHCILCDSSQHSRAALIAQPGPWRHITYCNEVSRERLWPSQSHGEMEKDPTWGSEPELSHSVFF